MLLIRQSVGVVKPRSKLGSDQRGSFRNVVHRSHIEVHRVEYAYIASMMTGLNIESGPSSSLARWPLEALNNVPKRLSLVWDSWTVQQNLRRAYYNHQLGFS
jgi:hypothetical protein